MEKITMSVNELSLRMGISLPKAYELAKTPGFPAIHVGKRILIPVEPFQKWLDTVWKGQSERVKES